MSRKMDRSRPDKNDGASARSSNQAKSQARAIVVSAICASALLAWPPGAKSDPVPVVEKGLPPTTIPTYLEKGAPNFKYPSGGADAGSGGGAPGEGDGGGQSGSGGNDDYNACPGCDPMQKMMAQPWGADACNAATKVGITCDALAATCVVESRCRNVQGVGSVSGAFQMTDATYREMVNQAARENADAGIDTSLAGKNNPANQAWASAQYNYNGATYLQNNGIENPTFTDVRGYYQFGPRNAVDLATARNSDNLQSIVNLSPAAMQANGITAATTVGEWRQRITNQVGSVATQPVLR